jgi:hypothetical protein
MLAEEGKEEDEEAVPHQFTSGTLPTKLHGKILRIIAERLEMSIKQTFSLVLMVALWGAVLLCISIQKRLPELSVNSRILASMDALCIYARIVPSLLEVIVVVEVADEEALGHMQVPRSPASLRAARFSSEICRSTRPGKSSRIILNKSPKLNMQM